MIENNAFHNLLINVITLFDRVFGPICLEPPYKFIFPSYIYAVVVNACCDWYEFVTLWLIATITLSRILEFFFFTLSRAISTCLLRFAYSLMLPEHAFKSNDKKQDDKAYVYFWSNGNWWCDVTAKHRKKN